MKNPLKWIRARFSRAAAVDGPIKVKDVHQPKPGCKHCVAVFDMGDGTEHVEVAHEKDELSPEEKQAFVRAWLKYQVKHKANRTKLKGKEIAPVEK